MCTLRFAAGSGAWSQGHMVLAKGSCAHLVVFTCRPRWIQALAPQNASHYVHFSVTASSGWPLSLSEITILLFSESKPLVFQVYHNRRNSSWVIPQILPLRVTWETHI